MPILTEVHLITSSPYAKVQMVCPSGQRYTGITGCAPATGIAFRIEDLWGWTPLGQEPVKPCQTLSHTAPVLDHTTLRCSWDPRLDHWHRAVLHWGPAGQRCLGRQASSASNTCWMSTAYRTRPSANRLQPRQTEATSASTIQTWP